MLIFDEHRSHIDVDNVIWLLERRVIPVCLSPHCTNILQPLDVGCFDPLQKAYSDLIDRRLYMSGGRLTMSKQDLWGVYRAARSRAFTNKTIRSAWRAAGLYPIDQT